MNLKKILILPAAFILVHVLYIGCCKCLEGIFHREVSSLRVYESSNSGINSVDTVRVVDTLFSYISINYNHIAKNEVNPFSQFVNSAYAFQCNCDNYRDSGFKYKLDSLVIASDATFKGIPPGNNINSYFTGIFYTYNGAGGSVSYLPIPRLVDSLNANRNYYQLNLFTTATGLTDKIHRLKYTLFYSNGKSYEGRSNKILIWP